jgi:hypothetical protein
VSLAWLKLRPCAVIGLFVVAIGACSSSSSSSSTVLSASSATLSTIPSTSSAPDSSDASSVSSPAPTTDVSATSPQTDGSTFPTPSSTPETVTANLTFGPGPFTLTQPTTGLAALTGYSATLSVSFDGTRNGQPSTWVKTYTRQNNSTPAAGQLTVDSSGDLTDVSCIVQIETAGVSFDKRGEAPCTATVSTDGDPLVELFQPAAALTGVIGADSAGSDTVDGTATMHYIFDEKALALIFHESGVR